MKEIFQLSEVKIVDLVLPEPEIVLEDGNEEGEEKEEVPRLKRMQFSKATTTQCDRCRLYNIPDEKSIEKLCDRCSKCLIELDFQS